jgi:4,5-dihydroxyphthalate decarboxylase
MTDQGRTTLFTLLALHPNTAALRTGKVRSNQVDFKFADVKVSNTEFKPLVREHKYDLAELATVTYLQAYEKGDSYVLLPATVVGRNQHHTIFYNADRGVLNARELTGKRVGVRAYTQTTGAWVRGFLAEDYGVDIERVKWVTFEDAHVARYRDPEFVERAPAGRTIKQMLLDGELDAAILGDYPEEGPLKHLIPDHEDAGRAWAKRHGGVPINHLVVIRESIAEEHPEVVREVYRLLKESRAAANAIYESGDVDPLRFGVRRVRQSFETLVDYALKQKLITQRVTAAEVFSRAIAILGSAAE